MKRFLLILPLLALFAGANKAAADYYVGEQIGLADLRDGDLVIFEGAAASGDYGKYLTDATVTDSRALTDRSAIRIYKGLTEAAVWRLVSTGTLGSFYLQNVSSGYYYTRASDLGRMTTELSSAEPIKMYQFPDGFPTGSQTQRYTDWAGNPVGWNMKSIAMQQTNNSYYLCCNGSDMVYGDQHHTHYWNMFRVSTDASEGTAFSSYDGSTSTTSGVTIDGLVYNLTTINTPSGNVAQLTNANKSLNVTSVNIPAYVTYNGKTFHVNGFQGAAFEAGKFSTLTIEPNTFYIGDWVFGNCKNVTEVEVPEGVSILVSNRAFGYMSSLETVTMPSTMKTIEDYTFSEDPKLTTLIFNGTTPPTFKGTHLFENTPTANISIVVPTEDAVTAYTQAIATYNSTYGMSVEFKEITVNPKSYGTEITEVSEISDGKYYFIISQFDGFRQGAKQGYGEKEAALGYSSLKGAGSLQLANVVSWVVQNRNTPDANVVWKIVKDGDNYQLKNIGSGKYAGAASDGNGNRIGWTDEYEVAQKITSTGDGNFTIGNASSTNTNTWKISGGYHGNAADCVEAAAGTDPYGGTAGSERAWKIYELSDVQIASLAEAFVEELTLAVGAGAGVVMGMKDEASLAEAKALTLGKSTLDKLSNAANNIMPLTDGYYRIKFPKTASGVYGGPYMYFNNSTLQLSANKNEAQAKVDHSTIYNVTVLSDSYRYTNNNNCGNGYEVTLVAQGGYSPYYYGSYTDQKRVTNDNSNIKAHIFQPEIGFDDNTKGALIIDVTGSGGGFTNHCLLKTKDAVDNAIKANPPRGEGTKWPKGHEAYLEPATDITVTLHKSGDYCWGTIRVPFGITLPEGTAAYVGKVDGDKFKLTSVGQQVPAGLPVILCGDSESITATITDGIADFEGESDLEGTYLANSEASTDILTLGEADGAIGLYKYAYALGANKAYLPVSAVAGSNGYKFVFADDDDLTGISASEKIIENRGQILDLFGRRVATPQKGNLYIVNGKAVKF